MARRVVVLVRHGQYDLDKGGEGGGGLTELGREQIVRTATKLRRFRFDAVYASTLPRALESARIAVDVLGHSRFLRSPMLREGFPTKVRGYTTLNVAEDRARFERAYDRYFAKPTKSSTELLVCHGNIIRYFVCRALGIPISRWLRLGTSHAAITRIVVKDNGVVGVAAFNETSHFSKKLLT